MNMNDAGMG